MTLPEMIEGYKRWLDVYNSKGVGAQDLCDIQNHLKKLEGKYAKAKKPRITFGEFVNAVNKEVGLEPLNFSILIYDYLGHNYTALDLERKENALVQYWIDYDNFHVHFVLEQSLKNVGCCFVNDENSSLHKHAVVTGDFVNNFPMQMSLRQIVESGAVGKIYGQLMQNKIESKRAITKNS